MAQPTHGQSGVPFCGIPANLLDKPPFAFLIEEEKRLRVGVVE